MALTSGFYDAINHDRQYNATQFGEMFDGFISDGVYRNILNSFSIVPGVGVEVKVKSGKAWFNHIWVLNTADLPLELTLPDLLLPRIDAAIIEIDTRVAVRSASIKIITGASAVNPSRPTITSGDEVYRYPLAYINVAANTNVVTQSDITSTVGGSECPYVSPLLDTSSIANLYSKWEGEFVKWMAYIESITDESEVVALRVELDKIKPKVDAIEPDIVKLETLLNEVKTLLGGG